MLAGSFGLGLFSSLIFLMTCPNVSEGYNHELNDNTVGFPTIFEDLWFGDEQSRTPVGKRREVWGNDPGMPDFNVGAGCKEHRRPG